MEDFMMNFNHTGTIISSANLRTEYSIVSNNGHSGDSSFHCPNFPSRYDIRMVAGLKIFAFIVLQAWRKSKNELKLLKLSAEDLKKSCMRTENQLRVFNTLIRVEQSRNDELTAQLKRTLENLKRKTASCETTSLALSTLKANKALLEQELKNRYEEYDALHELLAQTKTELFRSMMKQRNLQLELCKEQRSVQSLESQKNMLITQICDLNRKHRKKEELFMQQLKDNDCGAKETKQFLGKCPETLSDGQKNADDATDRNEATDNVENESHLSRLHVGVLQKYQTNALSRRIGMYWTRFMEYPKYTLHCVHTLTYYLLPALPSPSPKLTH